MHYVAEPFSAQGPADQSFNSGTYETKVGQYTTSRPASLSSRTGVSSSPATATPTQMIVPCPAVGPTPTGPSSGSASPQTRPSPAIGCSAGTVTFYPFGDARSFGGRPPKLRPGGRRPGAHPQPSGLLDRQPRRCRLHLRRRPNLGGEPDAPGGRDSLQHLGDTRRPGYWLFTNRGPSCCPYGHAQSFGDMSAAHLNGPSSTRSPLRRASATTWSPPTAGSSPSATPTTPAPWAGRPSTPRSSHWYRTATARATACRLRRRHLRLRRPLPGLNGRHPS